MALLDRPRTHRALRLANLLAESGGALALDVGCADGVLHAALPAWAPRLVGADRSTVLVRAHPAPVVQADAARLPFRDAVFDAVTALNMLYHLPDPLPAVAEAYRVLRPGGQLMASAIARDDSPEFAAHWTRPATGFDAKDAPDLIAQVFDAVTVHAWDAPLVTLPDADAVRDYLLGRRAPAEIAVAAARALPVPLEVTKRGALIVATRPG